MTLFISLILIIPFLMWISTIIFKKKPYIFSYILVQVLVYGILTFITIFFLRGILFDAQTFSIWNLVFIDQTNAIFLVLITSLSSVINLYALTYFKKEIEHKEIWYWRLREYSLLINMFIFSMIFATISNNLIITWIWLEATTVFTTFLISIYNTETSREAAWKYIIICSIWLTIWLFWLFLMLYSGLPSLNIHEMLSGTIDISHINISLLKFSFLFVIVWFWTKAALFPMNTWLPDAHGKAPSPVSAFMSSILLPLALYVIFRVKQILDLIIPGFVSNILLVFGIVTLIFSGIILIKQGHFKRALAYSSSEHMWIIAIAFALNVPLLAFAHIIFHSFVKAASFMSAGNVLLSLGSWQFDKIKNLLRYMKYTPILLIIALIFLMWIPPSYLFVTEIVLIIKAFIYNPWAAVIITLAILLATSGLLINFSKMFKDKSIESDWLEEHIFSKVEDDFHRNGRHLAILISLLFPILLIAIASIWFWRIG